MLAGGCCDSLPVAICCKKHPQNEFLVRTVCKESTGGKSGGYWLLHAVEPCDL